MFVRQHWRILLAGGLGTGVLVVLVGLFAHRQWSVESRFLAQSRRGGNNLSQLAAQFGVTAPSADGQQTPQFFADLVVSREILRRVVRAPLDTGAPPTAWIASLLAVVQPDSARAEEETVRQLGSRVESEVSPKTGVVTLRVRIPSAAAATALNARLLALLDEFNRDTRRTQSTAERQFTEVRQAQLREELRRTEDSIQRFLEVNRSGTTSSPELKFIYDRLQRSVQLKQQVYGNMAQAFEQARIDEVRDTPVITVIEAPHRPARPQSRQLAVKGILGTVIGMVLAVVWSLLRPAFRVRLSTSEPRA